MRLKVSEGAEPGIYSEGQVKIAVHKGVFYNIHAKLSRDIAIAMVSAYKELIGRRKLFFCEPLAATGVRAIRIFLESNAISSACINDLSKAAYINMVRNIKMNGLDGKIEISNEDANLHLLRHAWNTKPDIIDLDPFGSPAPYIDAAIQAVKGGGLLAITATDLAPLCAVHGKSALRRYHAFPVKTPYCKEVALRILIGFVARVSATHDVGIMPVLSYWTRHYIRSYLVVRRGVRWANINIDNIGFLEHCPKCGRRWVVHSIAPNAKGKCVCGSSTVLAGPLWVGPIMDSRYVGKALERAGNLGLNGAVKTLKILNEESFHSVGYYQLDEVASAYRCSSPPIKKLVELLRSWGFKASRTHFDPKGIRTDAPYETVLEAMKHYDRNCQMI